MITNVPVTWTPKPGTPDYTSSDGRFVAIYHCTDRSGYANYWTFFATTRKRTLNNALGVGGLPKSIRCTADELV